MKCFNPIIIVLTAYEVFIIHWSYAEKSRLWNYNIKGKVLVNFQKTISGSVLYLKRLGNYIVVKRNTISTIRAAIQSWTQGFSHWSTTFRLQHPCYWQKKHTPKGGKKEKEYQITTRKQLTNLKQKNPIYFKSLCNQNMNKKEKKRWNSSPKTL